MHIVRSSIVFEIHKAWYTPGIYYFIGSIVEKRGKIILYFYIIFTMNFNMLNFAKHVPAKKVALDNYTDAYSAKKLLAKIDPIYNI